MKYLYFLYIGKLSFWALRGPFLGLGPWEQPWLISWPVISLKKYKAQCIHRFENFIEECEYGIFEFQQNETNDAFMIMLNEAFIEFCTKCQTSANNPSDVCASFLEFFDGYWRCVFVVTQENVWLSMVECVHWQGTHIIAGKENYVTEGLRRNETMFGLGMAGINHEWICMNWFFVMTPGGVCLAMDELNEFLNLWNEVCCHKENFSTVCDR